MMENLKHRTLNIENMTCPACPKTIIDGLSGLDGVHDVKADFSKGTVDVVYDLTKIDLEKIEIALGKMGYSLRESVLGNLKKSFIHFTEENEKSNLEAIPRPCCTVYEADERERLEKLPPSGT